MNYSEFLSIYLPNGAVFVYIENYISTLENVFSIFADMTELLNATFAECLYSIYTVDTSVKINVFAIDKISSNFLGEKMMMK